MFKGERLGQSLTGCVTHMDSACYALIQGNGSFLDFEAQNPVLKSHVKGDIELRLGIPIGPNVVTV